MNRTSSRVRLRLSNMTARQVSPPLSGVNHSKTVYSWPANPQESAKVFGSCRLVPRRFSASGPSDLSDAQWSSPSGFDMVDLSRISEKREGFHASRGRLVSQTGRRLFECIVVVVLVVVVVVDATKRAQGRPTKSKNSYSRVHGATRRWSRLGYAVVCLSATGKCRRETERTARSRAPAADALHPISSLSHSSLCFSAPSVSHSSFFFFSFDFSGFQRALRRTTQSYLAPRQPINLDSNSFVHRICGISVRHLLAFPL